MIAQLVAGLGFCHVHLDPPPHESDGRYGLRLFAAANDGCSAAAGHVDQSLPDAQEQLGGQEAVAEAGRVGSRDRSQIGA